MKEHLFEKRIAKILDGDEYQAVFFRGSYGTYESGRCYLLSRVELESIDRSLYIVDYSLQGLLDKVRSEHRTDFSSAELEVVLGECWITRVPVINLTEPVLVDDGHICEKDGIIWCQDMRGGFVASTGLLDPSKRLSILIPHTIIPLIKNGGDLTAIDQDSLPRTEIVRILTFMDFIDETISRKTREISPNHPGLVRFHDLIHKELYERMPRIIASKESQFVFFTSPEFLELWDNYRRMFIAIEKYSGCERYVNFIDNFILPLVASLMCPYFSSLALTFLVKLTAGLGVLVINPIRNSTNFLCSKFYHPDLTGDGLDLTPFIEAMRKNLEDQRATPVANPHPHSE